LPATALRGVGKGGDVVGRRSVPHGDHGAGGAAVSVVPVKRPQPGVRWGDDDLIPMDSLRRCKVCKQPIEHLEPRRVTCGHPRCMRLNRNNKRMRPSAGGYVRGKTAAQTYADEQQHKADKFASKVKRGYLYAKGRGADETTALAWVAKNTDLSMMQVREIVRED